MVWICEIGVLLVVAVGLRHVLHMGRTSAPEQGAPRFRRPHNNPICSPLAAEIEAHTTILGVLLNDAVEEQNSGNTENASRVLSIFDSERERLVALVVSLQNLSLKYLPAVQYPLDGRTLDPQCFRSQPVNDFLKRHGGLEQFVFRSKLRFQLQLRLLRRATALLNESFEVLKHESESNAVLFGAVLSQMDFYYHDLDLLTKESLLNFSAEVACLPESVTEEIAAELSALTNRSSVLNPVATLLQR
jgi:hypothetical protein